MCMKRLQEIATKFRSCPCLILFFLCIVPIWFTLYSTVHINELWENLSYTPLFDSLRFTIHGPNETLAAEWITCMSVVPFFLFIIFIVECCHWCNVSFIRGLRAHERKKEIRTFIYFLITFFVAYLPIACLHFQIYYLMNNFKISSYDLMYDVEVDEFRTSLKKIQVVYECCGIHNYTYWGQNIPNSCCIDLQKPDCTGNVSNIYQKGCLKDIGTFINNRVRSGTCHAQDYCLAVGVILLLIGVISLHIARKVYYGSFKCFKRTRMNDHNDEDAEDLVIGNNVQGNDNDAENLLDNQEIGDIAVNHNVPNDQVGNIQNANHRHDDERLLEDGPENNLPRRDLIQI